MDRGKHHGKKQQLNIHTNTQHTKTSPILELLNKSFHYDIKKYSFTAHTVNTWNSLPNKIVDNESVNTLKTHLDRYWSDQPLLYGFKAELARNIDRSKCDTEV